MLKLDMLGAASYAFQALDQGNWSQKARLSQAKRQAELDKAFEGRPITKASLFLAAAKRIAASPDEYDHWP